MICHFSAHWSSDFAHRCASIAGDPRGYQGHIRGALHELIDDHPFRHARDAVVHPARGHANWLALGLLLAAWNAADDGAAPAARPRPDSLRNYAPVSVRAVQRCATDF
jgi:hypothetical protein